MADPTTEELTVIGISPIGEGEWPEFDDVVVSRPSAEEPLYLDRGTFSGLTNVKVGDILIMESRKTVEANTNHSVPFIVYKKPLDIS